MYPPKLRVHLKKTKKKKKGQRGTYLMMLMRSLCVCVGGGGGVRGTHFNCIDKSMNFKWLPTTYAFMMKYTKSTLAAWLCTYRGMCVY